jgi:hypothetical protein
MSRTCSWPDCPQQVPIAMLMCKTHWFRLPPSIRSAIWAAYRPGQEEDGEVSDAYWKAFKAAQDWIATVEASR